MSSLSDLGNGIGIIIKTLEDGITVEGTVNNTPDEVAVLKQDAASRGPVSGEILATGTVTVNSVVAADTIDNIDVDGVNQLTTVSGILITGGDTMSSVTIKIANDINLSPPATGSRYTAQAVGNTVTLTGPTGSGATNNGDVVSTTVTGTTSLSTTDIAGGANGSEDVDAVSGARYFLNSDANAIEGDLTGSIQVTDSIIIRGSQSSVDLQRHTVSAGTIAPTRRSNFTELSISGESAADDDLDFIDPSEFQIGDRLLLAGNNNNQIITLKDESVSGGNIKLANKTSFSTGPAGQIGNIIQLSLGVDDIGALFWAEYTRSPGQELTGNAFYEAGLPIDFGHRQEEITAGGGTINFKVDEPLDKTHLELVTTGLVALTGNWSIQFTGSPKDGQRAEVEYNGTATLGAFSISIFGIALSIKEAATGGVLITAIWDDDNSVWEFSKFYNHLKSGLIQSDNLDEDSVIESKILDGAVTNAKVGINAVSSIKVQDSAITTDKINNTAVTLDKVEISLKEESYALPVSLEADEQGAYSFYPGYKCILTKYNSQVVKDLAPTNAGTVQAANTIGNMANGLITHVASAAFGDLQTTSPTTNNNVDPAGANDHFDFTTSKGNAGGRLNLMLFLTRVV